MQKLDNEYKRNPIGFLFSEPYKDRKKVLIAPLK